MNFNCESSTREQMEVKGHDECQDVRSAKTESAELNRGNYSAVVIQFFNHSAGHQSRIHLRKKVIVLELIASCLRDGIGPIS